MTTSVQMKKLGILVGLQNLHLARHFKRLYE